MGQSFFEFPSYGCDLWYKLYFDIITRKTPKVKRPQSDAHLEYLELFNPDIMEELHSKLMSWEVKK